MPHVFINRKRFLGVGRLSGAEELELIVKHFKWEALNAILYVIGGILLTIGSVLFLPKYADEQYIGAYIFIVASVLYITVSGHDLYEVLLQSPGELDWKEFTAALSYVVGAANFIAGSALFLPEVELYKAGAWNFISGSFLFVVGAIVNSIQIFESPTPQTAFLANLVAVSYIVGSTLYLSASVPYLFSFKAESDETEIDQYLAVQYIVGSLLFTLGGGINFYRAKLIMEADLAQEQERSKRCLLQVQPS